MDRWLIAAIERLPPRVRRVVLVAAALLLLATAITSLTLEASPGGGARRPTPAGPSSPARSHRTAERPVPPSLRQPVAPTALRGAVNVAGRFLRSYLRLAYGRASPSSVLAITPGVRSQLSRERAAVTPAERGRRPRVVSLQVVGTTPGFAVGTATVADGGITRYRLRFTLQRRATGWAVDSVAEG